MADGGFIDIAETRLPGAVAGHCECRLAPGPERLNRADPLYVDPETGRRYWRDEVGCLTPVEHEVVTTEYGSSLHQWLVLKARGGRSFNVTLKSVGSNRWVWLLTDRGMEMLAESFATEAEAAQ